MKMQNSLKKKLIKQFKNLVKICHKKCKLLVLIMTNIPNKIIKIMNYSNITINNLKINNSKLDKDNNKILNDKISMINNRINIIQNQEMTGK